MEKFARLRPYSFHLTCGTNIDGIRTDRRLLSAAATINSAGRGDLICTRRSASLQLQIDTRKVRLQNQAPLHAGNIYFQDSWTFEELIIQLNSRVFFWPGDESGPGPYGQRHFQSKLWDEPPVLIRTATSDLFDQNPSPEFCAFNSGSPRCSGGKKSPRGLETFLPPDRFTGTCSKVTELTYRQEVSLPVSTQYRHSPDGCWQILF